MYRGSADGSDTQMIRKKFPNAMIVSVSDE